MEDMRKSLKMVKLVDIRLTPDHCSNMGTMVSDSVSGLISRERLNVNFFFELLQRGGNFIQHI